MHPSRMGLTRKKSSSGDVIGCRIEAVIELKSIHLEWLNIRKI